MSCTKKKGIVKILTQFVEIIATLVKYSNKFNSFYFDPLFSTSLSLRIKRVSKPCRLNLKFYGYLHSDYRRYSRNSYTKLPHSYICMQHIPIQIEFYFYCRKILLDSFNTSTMTDTGEWVLISMNTFLD